MTILITGAPGNLGTRWCRSSRRRRAGPDRCHGSCMGRRGPGRPASPGPSGCSCSGRPSCSGSFGTESRPWRPPQPRSGTWSRSPIRGRTQPAGPPPGGRRPPRRLADGLDLHPGHLLPAEPVHHPRPQVRERDEHWVPAGKGRTAFVDARDVAARVHSVRSQEGTACILTDPAALTDDVRAAHWPHARDLGSFTRDHASPGRRPPWPLPERLASSTRPIGKEAACGRRCSRSCLPENRARSCLQAGPFDPAADPGLPRQ